MNEAEQQVPMPAAIGELKAADYNPRTITSGTHAALTQSLLRFGDLSGVVYNQRTGQLVGGHQRVDAFKSQPNPTIEILETLPAPNSNGTVQRGFVVLGDEKYAYRVVDWPLDFEKAANRAANAIHGDFTSAGDKIMAELNADLQRLANWTPPEIGGGVVGNGNSLPPYQLIIECADPVAQATLFQQLSSNGYDVQMKTKQPKKNKQ